MESTVRRVDKENRTLYRPVVAYEVNDRTYGIKGDVWSVLPPYKVGDQVVVRFKTDQPDLGFVDSFYERYFWPLLFIGLGLFTVLTIVIGRFSSRDADVQRGEIPKTP